MGIRHLKYSLYFFTVQVNFRDDRAVFLQHDGDPAVGFHGQGHGPFAFFCIFFIAGDVVRQGDFHNVNYGLTGGFATKHKNPAMRRRTLKTEKGIQ